MPVFTITVALPLLFPQVASTDDVLRLKKLFKAVTFVVAVEVHPFAGSVTVKVYVPEVVTALVLVVPPLLQT